MKDDLRYFLTEEREVTAEEFAAAEKRAGFTNFFKGVSPTATSGFSGKGITGRVELKEKP